MNLRTRAFVLALVPLVIMVLAAVPESVLQRRVTIATDDAQRVGVVLLAAYDVEDERLTAAGALRRQLAGTAGAAESYRRAAVAVRSAAHTLEAAAVKASPQAEAKARAIVVSSAQLLAFLDAASDSIANGNSAAAKETLASLPYLNLITTLQAQVQGVVEVMRAAQITTRDEVRHLRAISLALLALTLAALVVASIVLLVGTARVARGIMGLVEKIQRYRRGEPLGAPSSERGEIGLLDATFHEFAAGLIDRNVHLKELNAGLESFSYSISHDLRAPLRAVIGYAALVEEQAGERLDAETRSLLDVVQDEARRMNAMIDDLLTFSRLGRQPIRTEPIDMTSLVADVLDEQKARLPADALTLDVERLPPAQGDPSLVRHVWENLIGNAIKYSSKAGRPLIRISGLTAETMTSYSVQDNGVGFEPDQAGRLFGVFRRLHTVEEFPGTGVGLAIVRNIVVRHGGEVAAQGRPGEGATFSFTLPSAGGEAREA